MNANNIFFPCRENQEIYKWIENLYWVLIRGFWVNGILGFFDTPRNNNENKTWKVRFLISLDYLFIYYLFYQPMLMIYSNISCENFEIEYSDYLIIFQFLCLMLWFLKSVNLKEFWHWLLEYSSSLWFWWHLFMTKWISCWFCFFKWCLSVDKFSQTRFNQRKYSNSRKDKSTSDWFYKMCEYLFIFYISAFTMIIEITRRRKSKTH